MQILNLQLTPSAATTVPVFISINLSVGLTVDYSCLFRLRVYLTICGRVIQKP